MLKIDQTLRKAGWSYNRFLTVTLIRFTAGQHPPRSIHPRQHCASQRARARNESCPLKSIKLLAAATLAAASLLAPAAATAAPAGTDIVGGSPVPISSAPYAVQIHVNSTGTAFNCTGSLISSQWVLTARHCEGTRSVRLGTAANGSGGVVRTVIEDRAWSGGDARLLRLSSPYSGSVVTLDKDRVTTAGPATAFGWGRTCGVCDASPTLKTARVNITAYSTDAYGGTALQTIGQDGQVFKGDSGGPLMVNGQQTGVLSTGSGDPDTYNRPANYTAVHNAMSWITSISGVTGR